MINNIARIGNFTSSEIWALTKLGKDKVSFGEKALTYIKQNNMERRLGRSLKAEVNAKPLTWGKLLEIKAFEQLGMEYILSSTETDIHPNIPYWSGSKDGIKHDPGKTVIDIKCPITLESFCNLVDPIYKGLSGMDAVQVIRDNHSDGEKYYWQIVSNAIINQCQFGEVIVYVPYKSELDDIRQMAQMVPADQLSKHYWIAMATEDDLPFLIDGGYYKNINVIRFEIPLEDKLFLATQVQKAGAMLIGNEAAIQLKPAETPKDILDSITFTKIK